jgi:uncharacterized protein (UPF0179 family)
MHELVAGHSIVTSFQQRIQSCCTLPADVYAVPIELTAEVAALQPSHVALQGAYVMAGTRQRGLLVEGGTPGASRSTALPLRR